MTAAVLHLARPPRRVPERVQGRVLHGAPGPYLRVRLPSTVAAPHRCPVATCEAVIGAGRLVCRAHRRRIPRAIRRELRLAWGQRRPRLGRVARRGPGRARRGGWPTGDRHDRVRDSERRNAPLPGPAVPAPGARRQAHVPRPLAQAARPGPQRRAAGVGRRPRPGLGRAHGGDLARDRRRQPARGGQTMTADTSMLRAAPVMPGPAIGYPEIPGPRIPFLDACGTGAPTSSSTTPAASGSACQPTRSNGPRRATRPGASSGLRAFAPAASSPAAHALAPPGRRGSAYLYLPCLALPVRPMSVAMWNSHAAAMQAGMTCPCRRSGSPTASRSRAGAATTVRGRGAAVTRPPPRSDV